MNISIQDMPEIPINILLIFGIPGSGKSFTAQKIKKRLTKDGHICFILDYDLLECQNPEKILEAEGKDLLELFEQQAVYLYNKSDSGKTVTIFFFTKKYLPQATNSISINDNNKTISSKFPIGSQADGRGQQKGQKAIINFPIRQARGGHSPGTSRRQNRAGHRGPQIKILPIERGLPKPHPFKSHYPS
jgi:hypothetical protein